MPRTAAELLSSRLHNQQLATAKLRTAAGVVSWLGAVQAQDYPGARWAIGQRMRRATDADVERAFDAGEILRTHVLRPTWHLVAPADIRWLLALTAPRILAFSAPYYRRNELDTATLSRARRVLERTLAGGTFLTRTELANRLNRAGIAASGERLAFIMMNAELEALICSGPRRGKQSTYALLDERAPRAKSFPRDEALAMLARRYLKSHGPATIRDFAWWSGSTIADARRGVEMLGRDVTSDELDGVRYWSMRGGSRAGGSVSGVLLLPNYDEFLIAYQDRQLSVPASRASRLGHRGADAYIHHLLVDGRVTGSWRPAAGRQRQPIEVDTYAPLTLRARRAIADAARKYRAFTSAPHSVPRVSHGGRRADSRPASRRS